MPPSKYNPQSPILTHTLTKKYTTPYPPQPTQHPPPTCSTIVNKIIAQKNSLNKYQIAYKQALIYSNLNEKEYLKRYYYIQEYTNKSMALSQYYKFHRNYPLHMGVDVGVVWMGYQDARNKLQRKFIKVLMGEMVSESGSSLGCGSTTRRENKEQNCQNNNFSLKLKQLDLQDSVLTLKQICQQIDQRLHHIKPQYLYRGTYNDGVKQFKNFILQSKNHKKQQTKKIKNKQTIESEDHGSPPNHNLHFIQKQNDNLNNNNNENVYRSKFDSNKQFRKTFNTITNENFRKLHKKNNFSRTFRNKTVNVKPQSFSKTTANDTVSREEDSKVHKNRCVSPVRIRKCKSVGKKIQSEQNKCLNTKTIKLPEIQNRGNQKQLKKDKSLGTFSKSNIRINRQSTGSRSKRLLQKNDSKKTQQKSLFRQESKLNLRQSPGNGMQRKKAISKQKCNTLQVLIKTKLKLRG